MIDLRDATLPAAIVRAALGLSPHPEGGHYRETSRARPAGGGRGAASVILFLLDQSQRSHWHRIDAVEIWLWHAGAPLRLGIDAGEGSVDHLLGPTLECGKSLQATVPAHAWQAAATLGAWTLVSCVVAPAFDFAGFELAPPGWSPPDQAPRLR